MLRYICSAKECPPEILQDFADQKSQSPFSAVNYLLNSFLKKNIDLSKSKYKYKLFMD